MSIVHVIPSQLINLINSHILENAGLACSNCLQPASPGVTLLKCSRCHRTSYCNATCQAKNWKEHKSLCTGLQALNQAEKTDWDMWGRSGRLDRRLLFDIYGDRQVRCTSQFQLPNKYYVQHAIKCDGCWRTPFQQPERLSFHPCPRCELAWWCSSECKTAFDKEHTRAQCDALYDAHITERFKLDYAIARDRQSRLMLESSPRSRHIPVSPMTGWDEYFRKAFPEHEEIISRLGHEFKKTNKDASRAAMLLSRGTFSMSLTIAEALERAYPDISMKTSLSIHVLGSEIREALGMGVSEELLHIFPRVQALRLFHIGPHARPQEDFFRDDNIACFACQKRGRSRIHRASNKLYHDCKWSRPNSSSRADLVVAFNTGMSNVDEAGWEKTLNLIMDNGTPAVFTAYSEMESRDEEVLLRKLGARVILPATENKWQDGEPIVNVYWEASDAVSNPLGIISDGPHTTSCNNKRILMVKGREG
ncbi:hypothetical protein PENSPDRAFT_110052 [Peniophora sp. CONT]|nr:hypothetical protein PENSPDRAFT_110052 [Peniophora sp. CONT]